MDKKLTSLAWDLAVNVPEQNRVQKPRSSGITMVIDKGLGITATKICWKLPPTTLISSKLPSAAQSSTLPTYCGGK